MPAPVIGNNDYRGYLNYLGSQGDTSAKTLLNYSDNYSNLNPAYRGQVSNPNDLTDRNTYLYNQFQKLSGGSGNAANSFTAPNLFGGGASYTTPPPNWDLTGIYNQAGGQAASQVNPYYTKQLQDFQNNQAKAKALQQQQHDLNIQNLQTQLTNTLQGNEISRGRTSQDVLQNEQQIGQAADYRQQDQGAQFDQARIAQAKQLASQGQTTSGLGAQQVLQSQTDRNTQEQRQAADDFQKTAAQELLKARTFEDLSRSDVLGKQAEAQGEKQQQVDWDKFVQGQAQDLSSTQNTLEQQRLARLSEVQRQLAKQQINNMIHGLSNPQQRLAAATAYGGSF